jgi:hypothetical protein
MRALQKTGAPAAPVLSTGTLNAALSVTSGSSASVDPAASAPAQHESLTAPAPVQVVNATQSVDVDRDGCAATDVEESYVALILTAHA